MGKHEKVLIEQHELLDAINTEKFREASANGSATIGEGVKFERTRRITGYLVGTLDRFNNAKSAEVRDRVKHCGCASKE